MTTPFRIPEPQLHEGVTLTARGRYKSTEDGYTREQLLTSINDVLEQAAQLCGVMYSQGFGVGGVSYDADDCEKAIRAMIGEIK